MTDLELCDALEALYAYDTCGPDWGVHDPRLRARCVEQLEAHRDDTSTNRIWWTLMLRDMWISDERIAEGYGIEDLLSFLRWLSDLGFDW